MFLNRIFKMVKTINSGTIFALLPANVLLFAITSYNMEHSSFELVTFGFRVFCVLCGLSWAAFFCHFADSVTARIASIGHILYNLNWLDYPLDIQKSIICIILRSQEPAYFTGLGMLRCTLQVFGDVSNILSALF